MRALLEWFKAMPANGTEVTAAIDQGADDSGNQAQNKPSARAFDDSSYHALDAAIEWYLEDAISAAKKITRWYHPRNRAIVARVRGNLDAAESALLRRAPDEYFKGQIDHIVAHVQFHLPKNDPRRRGVELIVPSIRDATVVAAHKRESIIRAVSIASLQSGREHANVQSFHNIILWTSFVLFFGVIAIGLWGALSPSDLSLCFRENPQDLVATVCPVGDTETRKDVILIETLGVLAASVSGASSLRHMNGRSGRFGLPVALAILKLPVGALSAVLGLILVRGNFIPGLSDLDSSEQILAWAVVLGAAQQLLTGFVDKQAVNVMGQLESQTDKNLK